MTAHLHHYVDGAGGGSSVVPCPCGAEQQFKPPTGKPAPSPGVLVDRDVLRCLIDAAEEHMSEYGVQEWKVLYRAREALGETA